MQEKVRAKDAKQGRSGKQVLIVMVVSMALLVGAYVIYNLFVSAPVDRQAISWLPLAFAFRSGAFRPRGRQG